MNNKLPVQPTSLFFGIGTFVGLVLGLLIGWVLWPVEWEGATLRDLDSRAKAQYIAAVADAFVIYDNPEAAANARRRLMPLEENLVAEFASAINYFQNSGQPEQNIRISNIRQLAESMGALTPTLPSIAEDPRAEQNSASAPGVAPNNEQPSTQADADSGSWLRSLLWFVAVLLILGGTIFLLGASGLVHWRSWLDKLTGLVGGRESGSRQRESDPHAVDEFDEFDEYGEYDEFDDVEAFEQDIDSTDTSAADRLQRSQQKQRRDSFAREEDDLSFEHESLSAPDADEQQGHWRFSHEEAAHEPENSAGNEPFDDFDPDELADEDDYNTGGSGDNDRSGIPFAAEYSSRGGQPSAKQQQVEEERVDWREQYATRPQGGSEQDRGTNMFSPSDFEEVADADDSALIDRGYEEAYTGYRYTDDAEEAADDESAIAPFADDDDVADENWSVPTIESVMASPATSKAPTDEQPTEPEWSEQEQPKEQPDERDINTSLTTRADAHPAEQPATTRYTLAPQRRPPSGADRERRRTAASHKVIDQHTMQYQLGIPEYDESKPIVDPGSGKYIGEFGMGASVKNALVQSSPEQVVALEVWLFDKSDEQSIGNKTRILLSEYAVDNNLDAVLLKERQDDPRPFTAQPNVHFQLESQNLLLDCMIVEAKYISSGKGKGMFQHVKVDMSVHQKS